jgi:non-specific serine/threonine protein kinase
MSASAPPTDTAAVSTGAGAVKMFGRLQLLRLLGKSERTMAWQACDPRTGQDLMLVLPRTQPRDPESLERWEQGVRQAARLGHPHLAPVVMNGVQDGWPYLAHDLGDAATLADRGSAAGLPGAEAARLAAQLLQGLAYAHEAGLAHGDIQPYLALVTEGGLLRLCGVAAALEPPPAPGAVAPSPGGAGERRAQRSAAERDVIGAGLVLHLLLAGSDALGEPDLGRVTARLPPYCGPQGRDFVRLPWTTAQPVPDPLRAIVNRSTDRQERQRYRSARTLLRALEGWLQTSDAAGGDPLAPLVDRIRAAGTLPSMPGAAEKAARMALMDRERTSELAEIVLQDVALSFELLRMVNSAQARAAQAGGGAPVLTMRRAIAMVGLDGVRRAALALRPWPGPLAEPAAAELQRQIARARRAAAVAVALQPAAYDPEVVFLVTLLQDLGRLVVNYHFPEDAAQIRRLMLPAPPQREGEPEEPGMSEEAAAYAVIGADIEAIGVAVARHWGLDEGVLLLARRLPLATPVRPPEDDDAVLRTLASCAHETLDALALPPPKVQAGLLRVVQRYGRALGFDLRGLQAALQDASAPQPGHKALSAAASTPQDRDAAPQAAAGNAASPPAGPESVSGGLRALAATRSVNAQGLGRR